MVDFSWFLRINALSIIDVAIGIVIFLILWYLLRLIFFGTKTPKIFGGDGSSGGRGGSGDGGSGRTPSTPSTPPRSSPTTPTPPTPSTPSPPRPPKQKPLRSVIFKPSGGNVFHKKYERHDLNVTISPTASVAGAQIFYTLDGSEPSANPANQYAAPVHLSLGKHVIKAKYILGARESNTATAKYDIVAPKEPKAGTPTIIPASGSYPSGQVINIDTNSPVPPAATIYYTTDGSDPTLDPAQAYTPGTDIPLSHDMTLKARSYAPGYKPSNIVTEKYKVIVPSGPQVPDPVFNPSAPGPHYVDDLDVTISCPGEPGATIYYTTDSSIPTTAGAGHVGGILFNITTSTTVKAIAALAGRPESSVVKIDYQLIPTQPAAAPIFNPHGGTIPNCSSQDITMTSATAGARIYYTLDGTPPQLDPSGSPLGTTALYDPTHLPQITPVTNPTSVRAFAIHLPQYTQSPETNQPYTLIPPPMPTPPPSFSPDPNAGATAVAGAGPYIGNLSLYITPNDPGDEVFYEIDTTAPLSSASPHATGTVNTHITNTTTSNRHVIVRAAALRTGMTLSNEVRAEYIIKPVELKIISVTPTYAHQGPVKPILTITGTNLNLRRTLDFKFHDNPIPNLSLVRGPPSTTTDPHSFDIEVNVENNIGGTATSLGKYDIEMEDSSGHIIKLEKAFEILPPVAPPPPLPPVSDPKIYPLKRNHTAPINVKIKCSDSSATIYYAIDAVPVVGDPSTAQYTSPLHLVTSATVQAVAVRPGFSDSNIVSATFNINTSGGGPGSGGGIKSIDELLAELRALLDQNRLLLPQLRDAMNEALLINEVIHIRGMKTQFKQRAIVVNRLNRQLNTINTNILKVIHQITHHPLPLSSIQQTELDNYSIEFAQDTIYKSNLIVDYDDYLQHRNRGPVNLHL